MKELIKLLMLAMLPLLFLGCGGQRSDDGPRRLELFFLGHASKHHDSELLAGILAQEYFPEGINITYSTDPEDLTRKDLQRYDGLILYANHDSISPTQAKGLLDYVASGKGFIPLHSRSEEHTSELQSLMRISYAVFCLKKKKQHNNKQNERTYNTTQQSKLTDIQNT